MNFYTNVSSLGNKILYRGIRDGKRVMMRIDYSPTLYVETKSESPYKSLKGKNLAPRGFHDMAEAREYCKNNAKLSNAGKIYGNTRYEYAFIADQHPEPIDFDPKKVLICCADIEVYSEDGFPDPYKAEHPITAICLNYINGYVIVFGCGDYEVQGDEVYVKCKDEYTLCKRFLKHWTENYPDILTGWNTDGFDIPYIINRLRKVLGEDMTKSLSPWNYIGERTRNHNGKETIEYDIKGVASLDYIALYKWYAPGGKSQESYKLNNIGHVEIGETKISYDEFDSLQDLYKRDHQKFSADNIQDTLLILRIDDKLKLLDLALTMAYYTRCNYEDVFAQTRMWDALTYNYLLQQNIIVPPSENKQKDGMFEGAYVKEVQVGAHDWVASFDLNSLYSHLMMQYNLSPEMLIEPWEYTDGMRQMLSDGISVDKLLQQQVDTSLLPEGVTVTPNGQFYRTDKQGFMPKMLSEMYEGRKKDKNKMLEYKKELELLLKELENRGHKSDGI